MSDEGILLTWSDPATVVEPILSYSVYRKVENETEYEFLTSVDERRYLDKDLIQGKTYLYRVTASSESGEGPYPTETSVFVSEPIRTAKDDDDWLLYAIIAGIVLALIAILLLVIVAIKSRKDARTDEGIQKTISEANRKPLVDQMLDQELSKDLPSE